MILSVLIPTYNCDCSRLVQQLQQQLPSKSEIIVGDDCSTDTETIRKNTEAASLPRCRLYHSSQNIGRAAIRNALAREAKGDWLLFVDADAEVNSDYYISDYICIALTNASSVTPSCQVVCGGTGNMEKCPRPAARLRYDYEKANERRRTLAYRQRFPYAQFTTFNFMIRRSTFFEIGFDEHLKDYGHEDTLFGLELEKRGIEILHIDNKLTHLGLEDADVYLAKTETALQSLASMQPELRQKARVSAVTLKLKSYHLQGLVRFLFKVSKPMLRRNLFGRHPSQILFTLYKLGYYSSLPIS